MNLQSISQAGGAQGGPGRPSYGAPPLGLKQIPPCKKHHLEAHGGNWKNTPVTLKPIDPNELQ
jgi:hypothetical protein